MPVIVSPARRLTALLPPSPGLERMCTCRLKPPGDERVAYGKTVWSWRPLLASSRRRGGEPDRVLAPPSIRRRGWQDEFVGRVSAEEAVKHAAQGVRVCAVLPVVPTV